MWVESREKEKIKCRSAGQKSAGLTKHAKRVTGEERIAAGAAAEVLCLRTGTGARTVLASSEIQERTMQGR